METIILFAPLVGALICGFGWKLIGEKTGQYVATALLFLAALLSWIVFLSFDGETQHIQILRWIESGSLSTDWAIRLDRLTAIMLIVIPRSPASCISIPSATWPMTRISRTPNPIGPVSSPICHSSPSRC